MPWVTASEAFVRIAPSFQEHSLAPSDFGYLLTTIG